VGLGNKNQVLQEVLIATDGSETAEKAADFGIKIAGLSGAKIYALYVIDTTPYYSIPLDEIWPKEVLEQFEKMGHEAASYIEKNANAAGLEAESVVLKGDPAEKIVNFEHNVDMIIVGSLGKGGFERLVIGSVSEKVVRHAKVPVLVYRQSKKNEKTKDILKPFFG
jgi:nucleotide-binding universal stress UspA family protein